MSTKQASAASSLAGLALVIGCSVGKLLNAPGTQVIGVTPTRVVESVPAGSTATHEATLVISTADGRAPPTWRAHRTADAPWLTLSPASGSTPDTLRLVLDPAGLTEGVYRETIVIVPDDPNISQVQVPIELRIVAPPPPPPPPPPATSLAFTSNPPSTLLLNGGFSVVVTARDAQGNTAAVFSGPVSLTLEGPVVAGGLSGTTTVNAVNGIASFSNLRVTGLCTGCTLSATSPGLTGATSSPFNVIVGL